MNTILTIAVGLIALIFGTITIQLAGVIVLTAVALIEAHLYLSTERQSWHIAKLWQLPRIKVAFAVQVG